MILVWFWFGNPLYETRGKDEADFRTTTLTDPCSPTLFAVRKRQFKGMAPAHHDGSIGERLRANQRRSFAGLTKRTRIRRGLSFWLLVVHGGRRLGDAWGIRRRKTVLKSPIE